MWLPLVASLSSGLGASGVVGCGPSLLRVERANAYFERCFAADRDPARSDAERRACWMAWHEHHEIGQPPDRIDYVHERLMVLDPTNASALALTMTDPEAVEVELEGAEVGERDAVASEPATGAATGAATGDAAAPRERRRAIAPRTDTSSCALGCEPGFAACVERCERRAGACREACRSSYRVCARGCY